MPGRFRCGECAAATVEPFKDCAFLTLTNGAGRDSTAGELKLNEESRFQCVADTAAMASFGTVEIRHTQGKEPTTLERTLVFPPAVIADIQRSMSSHNRDGVVQIHINEDSIRKMVDSIQADAMERAEAARAAQQGSGRRSAPVAPKPPAAP